MKNAGLITVIIQAVERNPFKVFCHADSKAVLLVTQTVHQFSDTIIHQCPIQVHISPEVCEFVPAKPFLVLQYKTSS